MRKDDVDIYQGRPSVNVKVHDMHRWADHVPTVRADELGGDERFTAEWIERHVSDDAMDDIFWHACEFETEYVQDYARELFDTYGQVKCYREGRSGGHLIVDGLDDVETWDAIYLGRWAKFAKMARDVADGIPYQVVSSIAANQFEAWCQHKDRLSTQRAAAALPVLLSV